MNQLGPAFSLTCIPAPLNKASARSLVLSTTQAASLNAALVDDAKGAIYSSIISIADAFSGLQRGFFSWATVKLYYACFYLCKAALARRGLCVFYVNQSPYFLEAKSGASPVGQSGNSHTVVTSLYKRHVASGSLNVQPIDGGHAFDWITDRREDINYRAISFSDPEVPEWFSVADTLGLRRLVGDYITDSSLYAYDSAHAMIALPLAVLMDERSSTAAFKGLGLSVDQVAYLKSQLVDKRGPIHHFSALLDSA